MIEELLQNHLEELRVIRENAARPRTERGVGTDGNENGEGVDDDVDLGILISGGMPTSGQPPPISQTREPSPSPPQEYHGMYS